MKNIAVLFEKVSDIKLEIVNYQDPEDGTLSFDAIVVDNHTGKILLKLEWYYNLVEMMTKLDEKSKDVNEVSKR